MSAASSHPFKPWEGLRVIDWVNKQIGTLSGFVSISTTWGFEILGICLHEDKGNWFIRMPRRTESKVTGALASRQAFRFTRFRDFEQFNAEVMAAMRRYADEVEGKAGAVKNCEDFKP